MNIHVRESILKLLNTMRMTIVIIYKFILRQ